MISHNNVKISKSFVLDYVQQSAWAIIPEKLDALHEILSQRLSGNQIDLDKVEAALGRELKNGYGVVNQEGSAIVPVFGVIAKRMNMFSAISGGTSTELVQASIEDALADPDVKQVVLRVDSSGGTVDGTKELVDFIYASRGKKPITAFIDGNGCSAAYWIASAADKIVAYDTALVGSIGVVSAHYDYSQAHVKEGVTKTYIYAGKYKRIANDAQPLSKEGKDYLQHFVDTYYSIFVESVARNRGVAVETVLKDMADAKVFIGAEALKAGLIDKIGTFSSVLKGEASASTAIAASADIGLGEKISTNIVSEKEEVMDLKELKEKYPALVQAVEADAKAGLEGENKKVSAQVVDLTGKLEASEAQNKALIKSLSLAEEKHSAGLAESIKKTVLAGSDIPANLHSKIMGMIDHRAHVKEGEKFEEGSKPVEAFTEAFKAEVADWEKSLPKATGVGLGDSKADGTAGGDDADAAYGRELAKRAAGAIRSEQK